MVVSLCFNGILEPVVNAQRAAVAQDSDQRIGLVVVEPDPHRDEIGKDVEMAVDPEAQGTDEADIGPGDADRILKQQFRPPLDVRIQQVVVPGSEPHIGPHETAHDTVAAAIRGHIQAEAAADRPLVVELVSTVEVLVELEMIAIGESQASPDIRRLGAKALAGQRKDRQRKNQYNLLHSSTN